MIEDSLGLTTEGRLMFPRGRKGLPAISIDMKSILQAEEKIEEIRRATVSTLPDLITSFIVALNKLANGIGAVELEFRDAKRTLDEARAVALLERAEEVLRQKSIKSSADTREAAIVMDPDVKEAQARLDVLTAIQTFLYNKHGVIDRAHNGAKKICDMYLKTPYSGTFNGDESNG